MSYVSPHLDILCNILDAQVQQHSEYQVLIFYHASSYITFSGVEHAASFFTFGGHLASE